MRMIRPGLARAGAALALALGPAGCADGGDGPAHDGAAMPVAASGTLEQLAAAAGCEPDVQTDADELRQALCGTGDRQYVLATFATDRGQREWIDTAKDYGGHYLVGRKWVAVGHADVVRSLRGPLGGTLEEGTSHEAHEGGTAGSGPRHGGH